MKLIVGLGNPGKKYEYNRHNIGFLVLDHYLKNSDFKEKFNGLYKIEVINGEKVIFLKPQSYMNLSGNVVKKFKDFYKIDISDILIIYDDISFEFGILKLKPKGSSGGHNGLKNIIEMLGTSDIKRLKIGISKNNIELKNYVLSNFNKIETEKLNEILKMTDSIISDYINYDFQTLMNRYN